jgi:hypothetical protein
MTWQAINQRPRLNELPTRQPSPKPIASMDGLSECHVGSRRLEYFRIQSVLNLVMHVQLLLLTMVCGSQRGFKWPYQNRS